MSNSLTESPYRVIVIASARIPSLRNLRDSPDPTFEHAPSFIWSCAETAVIHFCAAAPAVRSLYSKTRNTVSHHYTSFSNSQRSDPSTGSGASKFDTDLSSSRQGAGSSRSESRSETRFFSQKSLAKLSKITTSVAVTSIRSSAEMEQSHPPVPIEKDEKYSRSTRSVLPPPSQVSHTSVGNPMGQIHNFSPHYSSNSERRPGIIPLGVTTTITSGNNNIITVPPNVLRKNDTQYQHYQQQHNKKDNTRGKSRSNSFTSRTSSVSSTISFGKKGTFSSSDPPTSSFRRPDQHLMTPGQSKVGTRACTATGTGEMGTFLHDKSSEESMEIVTGEREYP